MGETEPGCRASFLEQPSVVFETKPATKCWLTCRQLFESSVRLWGKGQRMCDLEIGPI